MTEDEFKIRQYSVTLFYWNCSSLAIWFVLRELTRSRIWDGDSVTNIYTCQSLFQLHLSVSQLFPSLSPHNSLVSNSIKKLVTNMSLFCMYRHFLNMINDKPVDRSISVSILAYVLFCKQLIRWDVTFFYTETFNFVFYVAIMLHLCSG